MNDQITTIVTNFVGRLEQLVLERTRVELTGMFERVGGKPTPVKPAKNAGGFPPPGKFWEGSGKPAPTKALAAARKVQGRYLGLLRTAKGNRRSHAKALVKKEGVAAAIKYLISTAPKS